MPTLDAIAHALAGLTALLRGLPDVPERAHALEHLKAVGIYAGQALAVSDEQTAPSGEHESKEH